MVERIRLLLKAMGFWVWGLLAIALAASVANVGYRWANRYRAFLHDTRAAAESMERLAASPSNTVDMPWQPQRGAVASQATAPSNATYGVPAETVQAISKIVETQGCLAGYAAASRAIHSTSMAPLELYRLRSRCAEQAESALFADRGEFRSVHAAFGGPSIRELLATQDYRSQPSLYRLLYLTNAAQSDDEELFAVNLYSRGYYAEAAAAYERAKSWATPGRLAALELAHDTAAQRALMQAAELSRLLSLEHPESWVIARVAGIHFEMGNYAESARLFDSVGGDLSGLANAEDNYVMWAQALMALNRHPAAARVLRQMLLLVDLSPPIADAWRSYLELYLPY